MIVKGIISAIYQEEKKLSVILPEYDNMTTQPLMIYGEPIMSDYSINEFVVVLVFNSDFTDAMVLAKPITCTGSHTDIADLTATDDGAGNVTVISTGATLSSSDDGAGNVTVTSTGATLSTTDDGAGNVTVKYI